MLRVAVNVCVALAWVETADCLVSLTPSVTQSLIQYFDLVSNKSIDWQLALNFIDQSLVVFGRGDNNVTMFEQWPAMPCPSLSINIILQKQKYEITSTLHVMSRIHSSTHK